MAGLLTRPRKSRLLGEHISNDIQANRYTGLTAAGTVPDSHRIPFLCPCRATITPQS